MAGESDYCDASALTRQALVSPRTQYRIVAVQRPMEAPALPESQPAFKPYVAPTELRPEFTARALLLGSFFGIVFGAVTVYVGLRAGLTVAASIPISVLSISILRVFGKSSILENNMAGGASKSFVGHCSCSR